MAFNFLGTFNRGEYNKLVDYAEKHLPGIEHRIRTAKSFIEKLGWIEYEFDENGNRIDYTIEPKDSQLAKYARAFEYYGGDLNELKIRSRGDWIYLTKGEFNLEDGEPFGGGQPSAGDYQKRSTHYDNTAPATTVQSYKDWLVPAFKRKLEDFEYKIKRTIDRTDQHIKEIVLLVKRKSGAETLDDLNDNINFFFDSQDFPTVSED